MKNKFFKSIILAWAIISFVNFPSIANTDRDQETGAIVGGGIRNLCTPTSEKACVFMEDDTLTVQIIKAGQLIEYLYNLQSCQEDWRGNYNCNTNNLILDGYLVTVITRGRDEYTFSGPSQPNGFEQVYIALNGRNEKVAVNGQLVPQSFYLNIGAGRVNTTENQFSLRFGDNTLALGSYQVRRTGQKVFMANNLPYTKYTVGTIARENLVHKILFVHDPKESDPVMTLDIGNIKLRIILKNEPPMNLAVVNNGKGPAGSTPPASNPTQNPNIATFEMDADGDRFIFRSTIPATIAQIRAILAGTSATNINNAHIEGEIVAGTQQYNPNWAFHLKETTIAVFTGTEFICDGSAKVINRNLPNIGSAGFFFDRTWCPNTSKLIREVF